MEEKGFTWTHELAVRLLEVRFSNDWLFQKSKQPWHKFRKILLENGFPKAMTVNQVRKKYGYLYDMYKIAKKSKNKAWPYYELFDKHYSKVKITDVKYVSWSDEWRLKLVKCVIEAKAQGVDYQNLWRTVEKALRSQNLPLDCCVHDMKGLWHHITMTFNRQYRMKVKKDTQRDWPLYEHLLQYYQTHDPTYLANLESDHTMMVRVKKASDNYFKKPQDTKEDEEEFQWTKHSTENFLQIRLQHDWMFQERKWAWNDLCAIMVNEYGFPKTLCGREIGKKWASTFASFQKAKATNNKSWIWYSLFELYLGEGKLSFNPEIDWQETWILNLISARTDLDYLFTDKKQTHKAWREVEKRLRTMGLPLDHSLLNISDTWTHLLKTFHWKHKFAKKGVLAEHWPFYDAMARYESTKVKRQIRHEHEPTPAVKRQKTEEVDHCDAPAQDDDYEDDMKLFDLKQKMELVKPKVEFVANSCRSCSSDEGCVNIFDQRDSEGFSLADKLRIVGDIQVDQSDGMPSQICFNCLRDLESAYKFRRKCQEVDQMHRQNACNIKLEILVEEEDNTEPAANESEGYDTHIDSDVQNEPIRARTPPKKKSPRLITRKKKRIKQDKYKYYQMCDICGKQTSNLKNHLDAHAPCKRYSCDACGKTFKFKGTLLVHKAVHEPTPRKTCEVCGKSFHIMAQYKRHFVYHANERKFECETCGKRFNTIDILKVHARKHTDERPFSCPECGKTFRTAGCVSRHKRIVHKPGKAQLM